MPIAFAAVLFDDEGRILLCKRTNRADAKGGTFWTFPAGEIDVSDEQSGATKRAGQGAARRASSGNWAAFLEHVRGRPVLERVRCQTGYLASIVGRTHVVLGRGRRVAVAVLSVRDRAGVFEADGIDAIAWALPKAAPWIIKSGSVHTRDAMNLAVLDAALRLRQDSASGAPPSASESAGSGQPEEKTDLSALRAAAEKGDKDAMWRLAIEIGRNENNMDEKDYAELAKWLRSLAEEGNPSAMYNLGVVLWEEDNPRRNPGEAVQWFQRAADAGNEHALFNLGNIHYTGEGAEQDYGKAMGFFLRAAEKGEPDSMLRLGCMYRDGLGVEKDAAAALEWFRKGGEKEDTACLYFAGLMLDHGDGLPQDYAEACRFYMRGVQLNDPCAMRNLGEMCLEGRGADRDVEEGLKLLHMAVEGDDPHAMYMLADVYRDGVDVERDLEKAVSLYRAAASRGHEHAWKTLDELGWAGGGEGEGGA